MLKKLPAEHEAPDPAVTDHSPALLIREKLLRALGEPSDLLRVQVRSLWHHFYRANVFVGKGPTTRMAHSFFLETEDGGAIAWSSPAIKRVY